MLLEALSRTILLAMSELQETREEVVLRALTSTRVVIIADEDCLQSHAGQSCFVATALMLARSGHSVWLCAPDVTLTGAQPPLTGTSIVSALSEVGRDLIPGIDFHVGTPEAHVDLVIQFGPLEYAGMAAEVVSLGWSKWSGRLSRNISQSCSQTDWPIGALAAASFACAEAFKAAMRKLREHARVTWLFDRMFAPANDIEIALAPEGAPTDGMLGQFDLISAGAITNSALFTLLRLPGVHGSCRIFDDDENELSNLNRNALLRRSDVMPLQSKVQTLEKFSGAMAIHPHKVRFDENSRGLELARNVLVGVDHIPSRWTVQRSWPNWLGVGATDAFSAYASFHTDRVPCVGCLHPDPLNMDGPIPTVAFVSFFAGLLLSTCLLRRLKGTLHPAQSQQTSVTLIRPETWNQGPVTANSRCPVGCDFAKAAATA